ncbi:Carbon catabolite repressor protein 4 3 [Glycine soja]
MASCTCSSWLMFLVPNSNCFKFNALVASQTQWHTHSRNIPQFKRHWVEASDQSLASPVWRWTNILNSQTLWLKRDMQDLIRDALEIKQMVVQCFGKLISSSYWKERPFNIRTLAQLSVFEHYRGNILLNIQVFTKVGAMALGYCLFLALWPPPLAFIMQMCKSDSRRLLVGNIHVLYNPNRGEVKLGQIRFLLSRAQYLSEKWGNTPVVLAGDFNSTPQSGIYKFLSSSELNVLLYYRKELSGQKRCRPAQVLGENKQTVGPIVTLYGYFSISFLGSNCTQGFNGELLATSYHSKFLGTVDYLWYSDGIVPSRVLDTVSISDLLRTGGLPCKKVGSDHLALVSEFSFSVTNNEPKDKVAAAAAAAAAASPIVDIEEPNNQQS